MRLTTKTLRGIILEVLEEGKKERIMSILRGQDESVKSVAIMSGQNPMAQSVAPSVNDKLQQDLEGALKALKYEFIRIGGIFGGHSEKSVIILNPKLEDMDELNRAFGQWGFVYGKKSFTPSRGEAGELQQDEEGMIAGEEAMEYQMYEIDYGEERGYQSDEYSSPTSKVMGSDELEDVEDNFSYVPGGASGTIPKGNKILIPLYGEPEPGMSDAAIDKILADLDSYSR